MIKNLERTIASIIDKTTVSFISTIDNEGFPNTKAMLLPRKQEGIKIFYFTTNTHSKSVEQYRKNPNACIYFCDPLSFKGIMLKGKMEVLEDNKSKEMIWQDGDEMYYHLGVIDPDYCVLKFTAQLGRFYSNFNAESFTI